MTSFLSQFGVNWANLEWSGLLVFIPLVLVLMWFTARRRSHILRSLGIGPKSEAFEPPTFRPFKGFLSLLGLALLIFAAIGPQWGQKEHAMRTQGLDMCLALDLSKSMLTEDLSPSRLKNAKNSLTLFLPRLGGDRVTVVGFAGSSYVAAPLSIDHQALLSFVDVLEPDFMSDSSTNIPQALDTCLTALGLENVKTASEILDAASKIIVVVSDGEDTADDDSDVMKRLKKLNVPVYAMAMATRQGGPIPLRDDEGRLKGYVKDGGENVVSKLQDKYLRELTSESGGQLYYAEQGITAWNQLEAALASLKRDTKEAGKRFDLEARFGIPLFLAFLLLLLDFFLPETKFSWKDIKEAFKLSAFLLLAFLPTAHAASRDPRAVYQNKKAIRDFENKESLAGLDHINEALALDSQDTDLRYNWATGRVKAAPQSQEKLPNGEPAKVNREYINQALKEFENLEKDMAGSKKSPELLRESQIKFQKGSALEMIGENEKALENYYASLAKNNSLPEPQKAEKEKLNEMLRKNISRLITKIEQKEKSSGGGGGGGGESGGSGQDQNNDPNSKDKSPPKEGAEADQKQRPEKFTGSDINESQAKQILQSVSGEEKEVLKRKAQNESKEKLNKKGERDRGEITRGKPW